MDSVQSLTDEVALLRKENIALTRENTVSRVELLALTMLHSTFDALQPRVGNNPISKPLVGVAILCHKSFFSLWSTEICDTEPETEREV